MRAVSSCCSASSESFPLAAVRCAFSETQTRGTFGSVTTRVSCACRVPKRPTHKATSTCIRILLCPGPWFIANPCETAAHGQQARVSLLSVTICRLPSPCSRSFSPRSEDVFCRHLEYSWAAQSRGDLAELRSRRIGRGAQAGIGCDRVGIIRMVEQVEDFATQHQVLSLANLELAGDAAVERQETRPGQHVASGIAKRSGSSIDERAGVEPASHASDSGAV